MYIKLKVKGTIFTDAINKINLTGDKVAKVSKKTERISAALVRGVVAEATQTEYEDYLERSGQLKKQRAETDSRKQEQGRKAIARKKTPAKKDAQLETSSKNDSNDDDDE